MQDEVSSADSVTNGRPSHNRNPEAGNPRQCWLWLGERSRAQQRKTAAERREVLRNGVVWRCSAHEATGRNRANTGAQGKKIPTDKGWDFTLWWRNAEPNPRPLSETDSNRWVLRARIRPFGRVCSQQRYIFDQTRPASLSFDLIIRVVCPRVRRTTPRPVCASNAHQANLSCHAGNCSVKRLSASTEGDSMAASLYP